MTSDRPCQGVLRIAGLLGNPMPDLPDWQDIPDARIAAIESRVQPQPEPFLLISQPNEEVTERPLIWPLIDILAGRERSRRQHSIAVPHRQARIVTGTRDHG